MVIFACIIALQTEEKQVCIVNQNYEVSSIAYFTRVEAKNSFRFVTREAFACLPKNSRHSIVHDDKQCYVKMTHLPIAAFAFVNSGYPARVAFFFLERVLDHFLEKMKDTWRQVKTDLDLNIEEVSAEFRKFQDPKDVDSLTKALKEVKETNTMLHGSIKKLLEKRGDFDSLVKKSKDLSQGAKIFYEKCKETDKSCCQLI